MTDLHLWFNEHADVVIYHKGRIFNGTMTLFCDVDLSISSQIAAFRWRFNVFYSSLLF